MPNKIIFLSNGPAKSTADIKSFGGAVSFFVSEEFERRGIGVTRENFQLWFDLDKEATIERINGLPDADAILTCKPLSPVRQFGRLYNKPEFIQPLLRKSKAKKIFTILGATPKTGIAHEHAFTMAGSADTRINWAADPHRCYPDQPNDQLNILIDHWKAHREGWNSSKKAARDDLFRKMVFALKQLRIEGYYLQVDILNRTPPELDLLQYDGEIPKCSFRSWADAVPYYRKAHIFCVTDPEEVGLSVIENAMCGSYIFLMHSSYLPNYFKAKIRCCGATDFPSMYSAFKHAIQDIDVKSSREKVERYNWKSVVDVILPVISKHISSKR